MVDLVNDDQEDNVATMAPLGPMEPRVRTKGLLIAADSDNNNRLFEDDRYFNQEEATVVHENMETQPE